MASTAPAGTDHRPPPCTGSELGRERQLAVLGLDGSRAPGDLLGQRDAGEAAPDRIVAHAVHDAARREERVHRRGVRRRARDPLDEEPPQDEVAVRRLILEAEASAGMSLDREGRSHRVARELGEELDVRILVGRRGLDGLAVHDRAWPGGGSHAVDEHDDAVLPVEHRIAATRVGRLDHDAAADDGQRAAASSLVCVRALRHRDSPGLSADPARGLTEPYPVRGNSAHAFPRSCRTQLQRIDEGPCPIVIGAA